MDIIKTFPGDIHFHLFEEFPLHDYPNNSNRAGQTPPNPDSEFLAACYVAVNNNLVVARAAVFINPNLRFNDYNCACIGHYDCIDDSESAKQFIQYIKETLKSSNIDYLIGPMNGSTWENYRFSEHNNSPNFFLEPYNPVFYNDHFIDNGFSPISNYYSSIGKALNAHQATLYELENDFAKKGVIIRNIDMANYEKELLQFFPFINEAFRNNFLYTPISASTFMQKYLKLTPFINPEHVAIAQDLDGEIVGFIFCYEDFYNTKEKTIVIKTIARKSGTKWQGLGHVLAGRIVKKAEEEGYINVIHAFMKEEGNAKTISKHFSGTPYKRYTLYGTKL